MARAPVSVLSPNFQRYLDSSASLRSLPPAPRIAVCCGTSTRDDLQFVDASIDATVVTADECVQAVAENCDVGTMPDNLCASSPDLPPTDSVGSVVDLSEDFSVVGSLNVDSSPETDVPESDIAPVVTSPLGASLVDSDDEAIATRFPSYLNSFKPCEVFVQQFLFSFAFYFSTSHFLFFSSGSSFLVFIHFLSF